MEVTVKIRRPGWMTSRRLKRARPLVLLLALALASPVLASDTFTDVPTDSPHHADINTIRVAGITQGCNPPSNTLYCPADPVRRDQMASFLQRGLGRVAQDHSQVAFDHHTALATLRSVTLTVPGSGFVLVNAAVTSGPYVNETLGCPPSNSYTIQVRVSDPVTGAVSWEVREHAQPGQLVTASTTFVFDVDMPAPGPRTFNVDALHTFDACYTMWTEFNAVWIPFGSTGGGTLGTEATGDALPER